MKKMNSESCSKKGKKIWVEVCLISARGLPGCSSSLWKPQWYAVGWLDPTNKYCTKIDASGNPNPVWKTKFATSMNVDLSQSDDIHNLELHIEVYSREPFFLGEKLRGIATVNLKEFLFKHFENDSDESCKQGTTEDIGSFQLRKKSSGKPQGFVDVSIRISDEKEETSSFSYLGSEDGFQLTNSNNGIKLPRTDAPPFQHPGRVGPPVYHPYPQPNYANPYIGGPSNNPIPGPSYPPPPPPPPPPSNIGYVPTFIPHSHDQSGTYMNMPSSGVGAGRGSVGPGFAVGMGAGALAAGAVMFGDDFMSGFQLPAIKDSSFTISTDPPF